MHVVTGTFHEEKNAAKAIQELMDASVPLEDISVVVTDDAGEHEVPLRDKDAVVKGAVAGGAIGAVLGGVGAGLAATGVVAGPGVVLLAAGPVLTAIRGIVAGAGFGYGIGLLEGLDHWKVEADLHKEDLRNGAALVSVHSDTLQNVARDVFERNRADRVSG